MNTKTFYAIDWQYGRNARNANGDRICNVLGFQSKAARNAFVENIDGRCRGSHGTWDVEAVSRRQALAIASLEQVETARDEAVEIGW